MPPNTGFLSARSDLLIDIVLCAFVVYLPIFFLSLRKARERNYEAHRKIQTYLLIFLGIVIALFELNIRIKGGAAALFNGGTYESSPLLWYSFWVHLFFAVGTFVLWTYLLVVSRKKWMVTLPGAYSRMHRVLGKTVLVGLILTILTSIYLYVIGLVL